MRTRTVLNFFIIFFILGSLGACDVLEQTSEVSRLAKCEFRLYTVKNLSLGGINIQGIDSYDDLGFLDIAKIGSVLAGGKLPLNFTLNVQAKNSNPGMAAMNKLDWIIYIDGIEMTRGVLSERIEIPGSGGVTTIPLNLSIDLLKALSGESGDALMNFGFNIAGAGDRPTNIMLKAKPTIYVGGQPITYPGHIKIQTDFTSL